MIYRDALGRPNAAATISVFGGLIDPAYYHLSTVSDCPGRNWTIDTPLDQIITDMEAGGWICTVHRDGYNKPVIDCIHSETQAIIDALKSEQAARFSGAVRGYVRFGRLPNGGKSRNYRDNTLEAGVSCFDAEFAADGSYRLLLTPLLEVSFLTVANRKAYRLYGDVVGSGSDGEPVLHVTNYDVLS